MQDQSFIYRVDATLLAAALLFLMLSLIYVGRWVGLKRKKGEEGVTTTAVSAMFGLMAFLLAFSFGGMAGETMGRLSGRRPVSKTATGA